MTKIKVEGCRLTIQAIKVVHGFFSVIDGTVGLEMIVIVFRLLRGFFGSSHRFEVQIKKNVDLKRK